MVVNREGDLELYALHDTPKQAVWSARGDLAISAGVECRIVSGHEGVLGREGNRSVGRSGNASVSRERRRQASVIPQPPLPPVPSFGRGDEDGFPPLGSDRLTATPRKGRTKERSRLDDLGLDLIGMASRIQSASRVRRGRGGVEQVVETDISMIMRRRASRGYGLSDVCLPVLNFHRASGGLTVIVFSHTGIFLLFKSVTRSGVRRRCWLIYGRGYTVRLHPRVISLTDNRYMRCRLARIPHGPNFHYQWVRLQTPRPPWYLGRLPARQTPTILSVELGSDLHSLSPTKLQINHLFRDARVF